MKLVIKTRNLYVLRKLIHMVDKHKISLHDLLYPTMYGVSKHGLYSKSSHEDFNINNKKTQHVDIDMINEHFKGKGVVKKIDLTTHQ